VEFFFTGVLYAALLILDYGPGRKRRGRRANALCLTLYAVSLAALVWALAAPEVPALTTPLFRLLNPLLGGTP
jgi:hypothetical protein